MNVNKVSGKHTKKSVKENLIKVVKTLFHKGTHVLFS